jgi:hypothetical protein
MPSNFKEQENLSDEDEKIMFMGIWASVLNNLRLILSAIHNNVVIIRTFLCPQECAMAGRSVVGERQFLVKIIRAIWNGVMVDLHKKGRRKKVGKM